MSGWLRSWFREDMEHVSRAWLGGQVRSAMRYPDKPEPDKYSRAVARRIRGGATPKRSLAVVFGWVKGRAA